LQNRRIKAQYARTNRRNAVEQMSQIDDICSVLQAMKEEVQQYYQKFDATPQLDPAALVSVFDGSPYSIGLKDRSEDAISNISRWAQHKADNAFKVSKLVIYTHVALTSYSFY
jgi:hypothetical protein